MKAKNKNAQLNKKVWVAAWCVAGLISVALITVFFILPAQIDARLNQTLPPPPSSSSSLSPHTISDYARRLHKQLFIADLHADSLLWQRDLIARNARGHVDVPRLIEGNTALQFFTIVTKTPRGLNIESNDGDAMDNVTLLSIAQLQPARTWFSLKERALYQCAKLDDAARRSGGKLTVVKTAADLSAFIKRRAQQTEIVAAVLGLEGAHALEGDLKNLDELFDGGVRMIAPTHFFDNDIGGSAHGIKKSGLTELGREMIRRMERRGITLDLAHASAATIDDALQIATKPVVVSHTGVRGTCDNTRNLSDAQLQGIAHTNGIIGIGYWETAVCGTDERAVARAIRYTANLVGVNHVALGSDFDGAVSEPFDATGIAAITDALHREGFNDEEIRAIMGGNVVRLLMQTLPKE